MWENIATNRASFYSWITSRFEQFWADRMACSSAIFCKRNDIAASLLHRFNSLVSQDSCLQVEEGGPQLPAIRSKLVAETAEIYRRYAATAIYTDRFTDG